MMTPARSVTIFDRLRRESAGQELLEMAFAITLLMMLIIGMFWAGRTYNIYTTINRAAREGARIAAAPSCATCGNAFPSSSTILATVNGVLAASNLQTASSSSGSCGTSVTSVCVSIQQGQALGMDPYNTSATWTVVSISYPFQLYIPFVPATASTLTLHSQAQMLEEGS